MAGFSQERIRQLIDRFEQLRDPSAWHDDIVVDLVETGGAKRERYLTPDHPQLCSIRLGRRTPDLDRANR